MLVYERTTRGGLTPMDVAVLTGSSQCVQVLVKFLTQKDILSHRQILIPLTQYMSDTFITGLDLSVLLVWGLTFGRMKWESLQPFIEMQYIYAKTSYALLLKGTYLKSEMIEESELAKQAVSDWEETA